MIQIKNKNENKIRNFMEEYKNDRRIISFDTDAASFFGLGERYCSVNHAGKQLESKVVEKFCHQGEIAYFPVPFFHTEDGYGLFVETQEPAVFRFEKGRAEIVLSGEQDAVFHFYYGTPKEIIRQFMEQTGDPVLPPEWAFGVWASANRWNSQSIVEEQLNKIEEYQYPASVIVLEAWSDEATFYMWNGSSYEAKDGSQSHTETEITYHEPWPDPVGMIKRIKENDMHLVLWQIPALKELDERQICIQHDKDRAYAESEKLVALKADKSIYTIPKQWFIGASLPDFTNPETKKWWFSKRDYLLRMGVEGFKTDGGEFVYEEDLIFYKNRSGKQEKNLYPVHYEEAYQEFIGEKGVLFSRAGYTGSQVTPMHWAGDQMSEFSEMQAALRGGLSLSLTGSYFWTLDLAGFAGPVPSRELYFRATALAAFLPAMQWHSEPAGGQFEEVMKGERAVNDRSPWNIAAIYEDEGILTNGLFYAWIHKNLVQYLYQEACRSVQDKTPFFRHLYLDYPEDETVYTMEDEYLLGDLLVAPVLEEGALKRKVYLPKGGWYDFWNGDRYLGEQWLEREVPLDEIPVFVKENTILLIETGKDGRLGKAYGYEENDKVLRFIYFGEADSMNAAEQKKDIISLDEFIKYQKAEEYYGKCNHKRCCE